MSSATPTPEWLTADRLTDVLRRSGDLPHGRVDSVTVESSRNTLISAVMRLRLDYSPSEATGPRSLFLKTSRADVEPAIEAGGRSEVSFYRSVAPLTPPGMLPRCYEATYQEEAPRSRLLLEDLSDTHTVISTWPLPPTNEQCERIIETYARFHAFWWNHPELGTSVGHFIGVQELENFLKEYERRFARFADELGERLSPERRRVYERAFAPGARLFERYLASERRTLVHGDAHVWNLLYPRDGGPGSVRLIDWDSWRVDTATDDLAYMMAVHWYPERRARLERRLLELYHRTLVGAGVTGYDFDALWEDYRLSVVWQLTVPVWQCSLKLGPWIWWSHLERVMLAFEDLGCRELLG